jgi:pyrophosphatase PpaX
MTRRPLEAALFDLDGTLIDSIALLLASMRHAFAGFAGEHPTDAGWIAGIGTPLWLQLAAYARSESEATQLRDRYREFQVEHHDRMVSAFPGTAQTLAALQARGIAMALVTSKMDAGAHRSLAHTSLARYIPVVIGADSVTKHKPDPEPVRVALERLGIAPEAAVFVGDSPHDIAAGNAAGVATVAALWGPFTRDQLAVAEPAHWLADIRDLPALLDLL